MIEVKERIGLTTELVIAEDGEALLCVEGMPGFHFPINIEEDVLDRIREMTMSKMTCPECLGKQQDFPCPTCNGSGMINRGHNPRPKRSRGGGVSKCSSVPKRNGHNDRKPIHLRFSTNGRHRA